MTMATTAVTSAWMASARSKQLQCFAPLTPGHSLTDAIWPVEKSSEPDAPRLGTTHLSFEGGSTEAHRGVVVSNEGTEFQLRQPLPTGDVNRVQLRLANCVNVRSLAIESTVRLGSALANLATAPYFLRWLTLAEWWNDPFWIAGGTPFRVGLSIAQIKGGGVRLYAYGQTFVGGEFVNVWTQTASQMIPSDRPARFRCFISEGDAASGRFCVDLDGQRVIDVTNFTHDPAANIERLNGYTHFDALKIYTHNQAIQYAQTVMRQPISVRWKDFRITASNQSERMPV